MYYVEKLRAWRVMRVFLVILGVLFLLCVIARLSGHGHVNGNDFVAPSGAREVKSVAPDGSHISTYYGKHGEVAVVRTDVNDVQTVTVTEPAKPGAKSEQTKVGTVTISQTPHGKLMTTIIRNSNRIPLDVLFIIAAFFVSIFASILGLSLSAENDGHLELAWTKPVSRQGYAGMTILVDLAAALALLAITVAVEIAVLALFGAATHIAADAATLLTILWSIVYVSAFYGVVMATTASLRRASGVALAILWPAMLILPGLTRIDWLNIGTVARIIDTVNPVAYFYSLTSHQQTHTLLPIGFGYEITALAIITVAGLLASIGQWRRLEA
ncbi:MAG: hypothetical protein JO018_01490 [Candidatus Eremiobacteraeota bacterium]|nr:hypothetical protein [Candidatus Eremiobacteraeota bacterium]